MLEYSCVTFLFLIPPDKTNKYLLKSLVLEYVAMNLELTNALQNIYYVGPSNISEINATITIILSLVTADNFAYLAYFGNTGPRIVFP